MITFKEKSSQPEPIKFGSLNIADTFMVDYYNDDDIFMKTPDLEDIDINAVRLNKGSFHIFGDSQIVYPVDLVIEYSIRT
jgi:hypothetical protein